MISIASPCRTLLCGRPRMTTTVPRRDHLDRIAPSKADTAAAAKLPVLRRRKVRRKSETKLGSFATLSSLEPRPQRSFVAASISSEHQRSPLP